MKTARNYAASLLALVSFLAFAATTPPGLVSDAPPGDGPEFTLVGLELGVAHPPGYPLYALGLRLAIAVGQVVGVAPERSAHLLSALCGGLALGLLAWLLIGWLEEAGVGRESLICGLGAALLLELIPGYWDRVNVAGIGAPHIVFVLLLLALAQRWRGSTAGLALLAYAAGLSLTHDLWILLTFPALIPLLARRGRPTPRALGLALLAFAVPLTLYATLLIRARFHPVINWGDPETARRLWYHITGGDSGSRLPPVHPAQAWSRLRAAWRALMSDQDWLPGPLGLLALAGAIAFARRARAVITALLLLGLTPLVWAALGPLPDSAVTWLPPLVAWAGLCAFGLDVVRRILNRLQAMELSGTAPRWQPVAQFRLVVALFAFLFAGLMFVVSDFAQHRAAARRTEKPAARVCEAITRLPPGALLLEDERGRGFALAYERLRQGRADVTVVCTPLLRWPWYLDALRRERPELAPPDSARSVEQRTAAVVTNGLLRGPVFCTAVDSVIAGAFAYHPHGDLYRIDGARRPLNASLTPAWESLPVEWGDAATSDVFIHLGGASLPGEPVHRGDVTFRLQRVPLNIVRGLSFAAGTGRGPVRLALAASATRGVCLIVGGRHLSAGDAPLVHVRVMAGRDTLASESLVAFHNVWDPESVRHGARIPADMRLVNDSCFSVFCVPVEPARAPDSLVIEAPLCDWPPGVEGEGPGVVVLAVTQVARRGGE